MQPISELVRVGRSCDDDWRSPLGDAAASAFGLGRATFVRSSANHVFVSANVVLRIRRAVGATRQRAATVAGWTERLGSGGAAVAAPVRSPKGNLTEVVRWDQASWCVTACQLIRGLTYDEADLPVERAAAWGAGLAQLHRIGSALEPAPTPEQPPPPELQTLPRDDAVFGMVHGDPELDNVIWPSDGGSPVFIDCDDASPAWFAADIAFALRDWAPPAAPPSLDDPVVHAFLSGYRSVRELSDDEVSWLPHFARWHARAELTRLAPVVAEPPESSWPGWACDLATKVQRRASTLEQALRA